MLSLKGTECVDFCWIIMDLSGTISKLKSTTASFLYSASLYCYHYLIITVPNEALVKTGRLSEEYCSPTEPELA